MRFLFFIAFVPAVAKIRTDVFPAITHRSPDWWVEKIYGGVVIMDLVVRIILCFIFPPLAVFDKGCGAILLVLFLTLFGWLPGTVAALIICLLNKNKK